MKEEGCNRDKREHDLKVEKKKKSHHSPRRQGVHASRARKIQIIRQIGHIRWKTYQ